VRAARGRDEWSIRSDAFRHALSRHYLRREQQDHLSELPALTLADVPVDLSPSEVTEYKRAVGGCQHARDAYRRQRSEGRWGEDTPYSRAGLQRAVARVHSAAPAHVQRAVFAAACTMHEFCNGAELPSSARDSASDRSSATGTDLDDRARHAARDNPIASAMVERAAAIASGDRTAVENLAATFAALGCPYQEARTRTLIRMTPARRGATTHRRGTHGSRPAQTQCVPVGVRRSGVRSLRLSDSLLGEALRRERGMARPRPTRLRSRTHPARPGRRAV